MCNAVDGYMMYKLTPSIDPKYRALFVCLIVAVLGGIFCLTIADHARLDRERLQAWMKTPPQQVLGIWLRPMLSGPDGPTTVQRPVLISDPITVARFIELLHSRRSPSSYLGPFGKWSAIRYAMLDVHLVDGSSIVFAVSWHETGDVCKYGILRNGIAKRYIAGDIIPVGASADLAQEIGRVMAINRIEWVSAHESQWR